MKRCGALLLLVLAGCTTASGNRTLAVRCHEVGPPGRWGAISGLAWDRDGLVAVHDHNRPVPEILPLRPSPRDMTVTGSIPLQDPGGHLDLEGIARREAGGFWAVSEGSGKGRRANRLLLLSAAGRVVESIRLPEGLRPFRTRAGLEGVAARGRGPAEQVVVAFQRGWKDDPPQMLKLARYRPAQGRWEFFRYPLDSKGTGVSALTFLPDGRLALLERDNRPLFKAQFKRIYGLRLPDAETPGRPLHKQLLLDLLEWRGRLLQCGTNGKFEGMAAAGPGRLYLVADDDGDASARILELAW